MDVTEAIKTRISVRAFKPDPLPEILVREIIDVARYAPSGGNLQPWKVIAVAGAERDAVVALAKANLPGDEGERLIYPSISGTPIARAATSWAKICMRCWAFRAKTRAPG